MVESFHTSKSNQPCPLEPQVQDHGSISINRYRLVSALLTSIRITDGLDTTFGATTLVFGQLEEK
eukprot:6184945-Amphidinium_carterae.1